MSDIHIRKQGKIGHITLNRPDALNALTYSMLTEIESALDTWATDDQVALVLIDAEGDRAFCAGGDIQEMYDTASAGNFEYGRTFWRDEYRLNAKIFNFPKSYVALMQGFTMGGGVGVSCHGSHRVVCESSQIALPECGIGLIPDVGGSLILARAPGRLGEYLGTTATRMGPSDAIYAGFADYYIPKDKWPALTKTLIETGDPAQVDALAETAPIGILPALQDIINQHFAGENMSDIHRSLIHSDHEFAKKTLKKLNKNSPLAVSCTVEVIHRVRGRDTIDSALGEEFKFTYRSAEHGDFIEGIRAAIIDKDRNPSWSPTTLNDVAALNITKMIMPLGAEALQL